MSRRAAAERLGISAASAVRFVKQRRESGATKAKRRGGDQRSQRIEEHHEAIMSAIEARPDMSVVEISEMLNLAENRAATVFSRKSRRHHRPETVFRPHSCSLWPD